MHLVERFWNHLRNTDGDTIMFSLFTGFMLIAVGLGAVVIVLLLVEWLGVLVVGVPIVIVVALGIFYGIGHFLVNRFDL